MRAFSCFEKLRVFLSVYVLFMPDFHGPQPMPLLGVVTSVPLVQAGNIALTTKLLKTAFRMRNNVLNSSFKSTIHSLVQVKQVTLKVVRQGGYAKELKHPKCVMIFGGKTLERELVVKSSVPLEIAQTEENQKVLINFYAD